MRRHRRDYEILSEMNLTNMLDTAFVLLVTFILVSPTIRPGLKVDLPQVENSGDMTINNVSKSMSIVIKKREIEGVSEGVYVDDHRYNLNDNEPDSLKELIQGKLLQNPKIAIIVEADKSSTYETFARVISILKALNIENVGLATDLEPRDTENERTKTKKKSLI